MDDNKDILQSGSNETSAADTNVEDKVKSSGKSKPIIGLLVLLGIILLAIGAFKYFQHKKANHQKAKMTETVGSFLKAADEAKLDEAKKYANDDAIKGFRIDDYDSAINSLEKQMVDSGVTLSDESKNSVSNFVDKLKAADITDYQVGEVKIKSDKSGIVAVSTTRLSSSSSMETAGFNEKIQTDMQTYATQNADSLKKIYVEESDKAVQSALVNAVFPGIMNSMTENIASMPTEKINYVFTLQKQDDGSFKIITIDKK